MLFITSHDPYTHT